MWAAADDLEWFIVWGSEGRTDRLLAEEEVYGNGEVATDNGLARTLHPWIEEMNMASKTDGPGEDRQRYSTGK